MFNSRASGILLHPTSLPSPGGIGDFGKGAYDFLDFMAANQQQIWQILPLGPTGSDHSPYAAYSALAGNPLLIDLQQLVAANYLSDKDLLDLPAYDSQRVDYEAVIAQKMPLLELAWENFTLNATTPEQQEFESFCDRQAFWLDDYALFMAIKDSQPTPWYEWETALVNRTPAAIRSYSSRFNHRLRYHKFLQFQFFRQWQQLKQYANRLNIQIFGDISFYVAHDSADVWANPEIFALDADGRAKLMAGVPPDYFSQTGQLWGNPVYNWEQLEADNYQWWVKRVEVMLEQVDLFRIDHFRGLQSFWAVERGNETAEHGRWIEAPGTALFTTLQEKLGKLPIVAEDLGVITPEVEALRDRFNFPGMKVLQFAFGFMGGDPSFLPHNYTSANSVIYTGTHDNNTLVGWFNERSPEEQAQILNYLNSADAPADIHWSFIRLAMSSVANMAIFPLQDILGLGADAKMNVPGSVAGNWSWRYPASVLTDELGSRLRELTELYDRAAR